MELFYESAKKKVIVNPISSMGIMNIIILLVLILPFLFPVTIGYALASIGKIKYITGLFIIVWFLFSRPKLHTLFRRLLVFCVILLLSTLYNKADLGECIKFLFPIVVVVVWCDLAFRMYSQTILHALTAYLIGITVINILCSFIYPGGMHQLVNVSELQRSIVSVNFIANDNTLLLTLIPGLCITLFYFEIRKRNTLLITLLLYILFTFSMFWVWTGTGVAISIVLGLILILDYTGFLLKKVNYQLFIFTILFLLIYICWFQMSFMKAFIQDFLGKSLDYTGRTYLWEASLRMIKNNIVAGYGMQTRTELFQVLNDPVHYSSHNMFFHLAIIGGILLPVSFLRLAAGSLKTRLLWKKCRETRILAVGVFGVLLYLLFETQLGMPWFWILLSILQNQDIFYQDSSMVFKHRKEKEVVIKVADALG